MKKAKIHENNASKNCLLLLFAITLLISFVLLLPVIVHANAGIAKISDFKEGSC